MSALRGVVTALLAAAREGEEEVCTNNPLTLTLKKSAQVRIGAATSLACIAGDIPTIPIYYKLPQYYERNSAIIF